MASAKPSEGASPLVEIYCTDLFRRRNRRLFKLLIRHVNLPAKNAGGRRVAAPEPVTLIAKRMASQASQSSRARERRGPRCKPSAAGLRRFCLRGPAPGGERPNPKYGGQHR